MKVTIHYTRFHRSRSCSARFLSLIERRPRWTPEAPTSQPGTDRGRTPSQPSNACNTGRLPPSWESENRDSHSCLSANRNTSDSWKLHHPHPGAHWWTKLLHAGLGARRPHMFSSFWPLQSPGSTHVIDAPIKHQAQAGPTPLNPNCRAAHMKRHRPRSP